MVLFLSDVDRERVGSYIATLSLPSAPLIKMGFDASMIDTESFKLTKKIGLFGGGFRLLISAVDNKLCLDIKEANIVGWGVFGVVRKTIGDILLKYLNMYPNILKAEKVDGKIFVTATGVAFKQASIEAGVLKLEIAL